MSSNNTTNLQGSSTSQYFFKVHIALRQSCPSQHGQKAKTQVGAGGTMDGGRLHCIRTGRLGSGYGSRQQRVDAPVPMESAVALGIPVLANRDIVCDTYTK